MKINDYIEHHSQQLACFVFAFLAHEIAFRELHNFTWSALAEWTPLCDEDKQPESDQERVFWHLLYELHQWDEGQLSQDKWLRLQLWNCALFLNGQGSCPAYCVGTRP
ncbi:hypothetical protein [Dongshaea marina]|uniref:hypothetical protein n=1 Tax=Dongshaea marina TaxID=2047966 RepID=UPI000D3E32E3|nr:hypothetical protein [Dongshaea marina]